MSQVATTARLAARLGIQTTRQTILRRIMGLPDASAGVILYLGIDDFSFRRGCHFGTILVNLESHRVVDLLPDREVETSAAWMRQQLDLMAVSRDRGGTYVRIVDEFRRIRKIGFAAPHAQQRSCTFSIQKIGFAAMLKAEATSRHDTTRSMHTFKLEMPAGYGSVCHRMRYRFGVAPLEMPDEENSEGKFRLGKSERMSRQMAKLKYNPHYASAAAQGAPQATQCADRFHLLKILGEAVEDLLTRHLSASRKRQVEAALEEPTPAWQETRQPRCSRTPEEGLSLYQQDRLTRYQQMLQLHEQGMTQGAIAQQIGVSLNTVQRWLVNGCPQTARGPYVSRLDPYLPYLFQRWAQGCHNIAQLFRELQARGYRGSYASVHDNIVRRLQFDGRKTKAASSSKPAPLPTPRQAAFVFLRRSEKLRTEEQETLVKLRHIDPEVDLAYGLVQQFAQMLRTRTAEYLDAWLTQVQSSNLPELQSFATGIEKDKDAVKAGLTWWINNGVVEGQVTKLKLIKRQGYGRAGFPLLRNRVLHAL